MSENCEACGGTGEIPILYSDCTGIVCSNERAAFLAGEVHHYAECEECNGTGEIEREEEDGRA